MNEEENQVFGGSNITRMLFGISSIVLVIGVLLFILGEWLLGIFCGVILIVMVIVFYRLARGKRNLIMNDTKNHFPQTSNELTEKGMALLDKNKYREAIHCFNKALVLDSRNATAWYGKVIAYDKLGNMTEAIECLDEATKISPEDKAFFDNQVKDIFNNKGINLAEQQEYESALACFESALHIDDKYVDALYNMGNCLTSLQRFKEALSYYDRVLSLDTAHIQTLLNKGVIYYRLEDYDKAIYFYDKVIEIDPQYYQAWHNKVFALKKLGKDREATECFRVVKKLRN